MRKPRAVAPNGNPPKAKSKTVVALAGIFAFGEEMLRQNALDPAYEAVHRAELPPDQVKRLLVVYCLFYHLGLAAYASELEGAEFWRVVEVAARDETPPSETDSALPNGRWPRVADRRYFRSHKCVEAVQYLARKFPRPEDLIVWLIAPEPGTEVLTASVVMKRAQTFPLWGPWASWKVADLLERLGLAPIVFPLNSRLLPDKPRETLTKLGGEPTLRELSSHFAQFPAPPRFERGCGLQEVETILCRWGSFLNGTTDVGKVIREIRDSLSGGWGVTAEKLLAHMPAEVTEADDTADDGEIVGSMTPPSTTDPNIIYGAEDNRGPAVSTSEKIYQDAVAEIKDILARQDRDQDRDWRRIGEIAIAVGKAYGEDRIGKLAKAVGLKADTLRRYRKVTKLAQEIEAKSAPGRVLNYSALRELEKHPDPAREFKSKPDMTKKQAQQIMRRFRKNEKDNIGFRRKELTKTLNALAALVRRPTQFELKPVVKDAAQHYRLMKELAAKHEELSPTELRAGGDALRDVIYRSAELLEQLVDRIATAEADEREHAALEPARQRLAHQRAKAAQQSTNAAA